MVVRARLLTGDGEKSRNSKYVFRQNPQGLKRIRCRSGWGSSEEEPICGETKTNAVLVL